MQVFVTIFVCWRDWTGHLYWVILHLFQIQEVDLQAAGVEHYISVAQLEYGWQWQKAFWRLLLHQVYQLDQMLGTQLPDPSAPVGTLQEPCIQPWSSTVYCRNISSELLPWYMISRWMIQDLQSFSRLWWQTCFHARTVCSARRDTYVQFFQCISFISDFGMRNQCSLRDKIRPNQGTMSACSCEEVGEVKE